MTPRKRKPASPSETYAARAWGASPQRTYTLPREVIEAIEAESARTGEAKSAVVARAVRGLRSTTGTPAGLREAAAICRKLAAGLEPGPAAFAALGCAVACETRAREIEGGE